MGAQEIYLEAGIREGTINVLYIKSAGKSWWSLSAGLFEETAKLSSLEPGCSTYTPLLPFNIPWKSLFGSHGIQEEESSYPNLHKQTFKPEKTEAYIWLFLNSRGFCMLIVWEDSRMPRSLGDMAHQDAKIQRSTERTATVNHYISSALHAVGDEAKKALEQPLFVGTKLDNKVKSLTFSFPLFRLFEITVFCCFSLLVLTCCFFCPFNLLF